MSIPRNTAPAAGAIATPAPGPGRRRAVMVGNLLASSGLFFFAACSDAGLTEPRAQAGAGGAAMTRTSSTVTISSGSTTTSSGTTIVSTSSTSSSSSTGTQGDTARVTLTVTPTTTATFQVNVHRVRIVAGSICEPATSGYGVGTWDAPCKPAAGTVTITAKSWTNAQGRPVVSFSPDVRFVPGKINTIWLMDPKAALQKADPLTWCPAGATTCVNEAQSDPSLATTYTSDGYATRRIKHFSGFTVGFGAW
jgi:hypothetical protein